jgi:chromosomal replication initiation ATPase DnaA
MSLSEIARHLGRRDHTTVMHAVARIGSLRQDDRNLNQMITEVSWSLGSIREG